MIKQDDLIESLMQKYSNPAKNEDRLFLLGQMKKGKEEDMVVNERTPLLSGMGQVNKYTDEEEEQDYSNALWKGTLLVINFDR